MASIMPNDVMEINVVATVKRVPTLRKFLFVKWISAFGAQPIAKALLRKVIRCCTSFSRLLSVPPFHIVVVLACLPT